MARYLGSELSADDVKQILDLVEKSQFETLDLQVGDLHLSVSKTGAVAAARPQPRQARTPDPQPATAAASPPPAAAPATPPAADPASGDDAGLVEITAPIVGIFYVAPEPGAEPFVAIGSDIDSDATVGLIEVMKVFNGVKSGVEGTIVKRLVEDSGFVEYGQPLFLVRPKVA